MNKTRNLKNYSENENYLKRILKRKISFTQGLLVAFLISGAFGFSIPAYAGWNNLTIDTITGSTGQQRGEGQSIKNRHAVVIGPIENERGQDRIEIAGNRYSHNIVVIGDGANTIQDGSTIIGQEAHGAGAQSTVVGQNAMAGNQGVAIGADTYAYGDSSIAIGNDDIANVYQDKLPTATIEKIYRDLYDTNTGLKSVTLNGKKYDFTYMYKDTFTDRYTLTPDHDNRIYSPTFSRGSGAIAIGSRAVAYGNGATTLGTLSFALADGSTAIGLRAFVSDNSNGGLAIGEESRVFASNSLAVGNKNESTNSGSMSYGYNTKAVGQSSIAIGHTTAANAMLTAASKNAFIEKLKDGHFDNGNTFKIGDNNKFVWSGFEGNQTDPYIQDKLKDISGLNFEYTTTRDVVLETDKQIKKTDKKGDNAIAVGHTAFADGNNSIALGTGTGVFGNSSVGIGSLTYVGDTAANTVAIGVGAYSEKENNVVLGTSAQTKGARSVLIGSSATSTADDVITIGYSASTDANKSVSIGHNSTIGNNAIDSILLGSDAFITNGAQNSIVVGKGAHIGTKGGTTTNTNSIAIGKDAFVNNASSSISLGNEAKADMDNSVALGYRSTTTYKYDPNSKNANPTLAGTDAATHEGYLPPGSSYQIPVDNSAGIISVGGWDNNGNVGLRRIVNVAPGFLDTDVATVGQLKALNYVKNEGNVVYYTVKDGKAVKLVKNHDGKFFAANTNNGEPLNDIEIPKNEVYIGAKGTNETTYTGTDKNTYGDIGDNIIFGNIKDGKIAQNSDQAVAGNQLYDLETRILGTTINNNAPELNGITKLKNKNGQDSTANVTNFKEIVNTNINKINEGISFGADNNNGTRQYLGSSLKINSGDITANGKNYKGNNLYTQYSASNGDGTIKIGLKEDPEFKEVIITNGPNLSETGLDMKNKKIINLTDGTLSETSKDAVTGSQLFATNKKVTDLHDVTTTLNEYFFDHEINKLDTDMGNIKSEGKGVIRTESIAAIDVVDAKNSGITVTSADTGTGKDLKKTFTVGLDANKIKQITGTTNLAADYAKADASNINGQNAEKWKTALGVSNIDLSYKSGADKTAKTTTLANGLTLNGDKNITIATKDNGIIDYTLNSDLKGITTISNKADNSGTVITLSDTGADFGGKKISNLADGQTDSDAVTVKQLKTLGIDPTLNTKKPVVIYDDDTKTTITVGTGAGQTAKLTNLTDAALTKTSTDAVTGKQLYDTNQTLQDIKTTMNKSWKIAANNDTAEKVDFDKAVRFKTDNNLELTYDNTNADEKVLTFALKDNLQIGNISIKNTKNPAGQGYTESVITGLTNTIWDKNNSVADRAATEGQLAQIVKDINASTGTADKTNVKYDSDTKEKITLGGIKNGAPEITDGVVLTNVKAGSGEKDAVNMKQILQLVGDNGVSYDAAKGQWTGVTFAGLKDKNGTAGTPAADIISAINANANKLNEGITFGADNQNGNTKQYLGSSLKVQSGDTTEGTDNYKGSNLYAKYTNQNGNGIITIGLKENPDFKEITLTDGGNTPYLTISKDAGSNGGKITGLADRTVSNNNIKDYGTGDNAGRAATEGALKDLADNLNTKSQLSYTANSDTNKKSVILTNGLNFTNGTNTTAFVDDNGIVKFNLNENLTGITTISKGINGQGAVITLNDDNIALNNKKLTGLADATTDTDAVNLKQLKDLGLDPTAQNKKPAVTYDDNTKTVITLGDGADVKLTNLKDGEIAKGSKDAVTGGQLFDKLNGIQNTINDTEISYAANTDKAKKVKLTDGFKFTNGTNTTAFVDDNGIVKFNLNNELTGITSIKGKGNKITLNTDNIDFGNQKLSGVANGTNDNDAVNISQFKPVVNALGGGAQINPDGSVKNPTYSLKTGADTATDYKNVGDALNAVDKAIDNSAKTDASNINVKDYINALNKGANISKPTGALVTDQNVHDYVSGEIGKLNDKVGTGNVAAGDTNTVSGDTVHKHLTQNYYDKTQTYNKTEVDNKIAGSVGNVALNITGDKGKGEINLKKDTLGFKGDKNITTNVNGKDVEIKLNENIAVKDVATEKITVSSPNNPDKTVTVENGNITAGKGDNKIEINGGNGNITFGEKPAGNNTDNRLTINGKDKTISNLAEGKNAGDAATKGQLDKAMEKAGDSKLTFTDNDGNKVAQASNGKFYKKSDIENGKPKANAKEVKDKEIKSSLVDKKGSTKNPTRLGNVAAGQKSTDAVNVGQLEAVRNEVNEKVQNNTRRINKIERSYKKGVANAVATAGVKFQEINTNEVTIGAAVGYYEDQGAVAVGIQGAPTENLRIHGTISATPGPEPEAAASVGFSWKFKIR